MSTGATFSPRLPVRPKYPAISEVVKHTALSYIRVPGLCLFSTLAILPLYERMVSGALESGYSSRFLFCGVTLLVHTLTYAICNGFFAAAEYFGWFDEYRLDRKPYQTPGTALLLRTLAEALINQLVTGPFVLWYVYLVFDYFGMPALDAPLPSPFRIFGGFALAHLFNDWFFYWAHRLFHSKILYKRIHKQHHTYNGTIGIAAEYASPLEQIFANQIPTIGGCMFFGAHPLVFWVWLVCRLQQTYEGHSGFCFYGTWLHSIGLTNSETAAYHDYHHSGNRGNFGALWCDWAFGTMDFWIRLGGTEGYIMQCRNIRKGIALKSGDTPAPTIDIPSPPRKRSD